MATYNDNPFSFGPRNGHNRPFLDISEIKLMPMHPLPNLKFLIAQANPTIGDIRGISRSMLSTIDRAKKENVDVVVFPELATVGYPPRDLLYREDFLNQNDEAVQKIIRATVDSSLTVVFGSVERRTENGGNRLYNVAIVAQGGQVAVNHRKRLLPNYDVFDEDRYFEVGKDYLNDSIFEVKGTRYGVLICEEIWNDLDTPGHKLYRDDPVQTMASMGAQGIIAINASPFRLNVWEKRRDMVAKHCKDNKIHMIYCNQAGGNDEIVFDGGSFVTDAGGFLVRQMKWFEAEDRIIYFSDHMRECMLGNCLSEEESVYRALVLAVRDYRSKQNMTGPVLVGLSGGIDSALVAVIATEAVGPENVIGIAMPSEFSSFGSLQDASQLANSLGIRFNELPIKQMHKEVRHTMDDISNFETSMAGRSVQYTYDPDKVYLPPNQPFKESGVADENVQARIRGLLLMALANWENGLVLSTGNKSEMAVGYCTLYGDMCGGYAVLCDVPKLMVYRVSQYINDYYGREVIPWSTIHKAPSAELRPDQKDSDSLPPYWLLDEVIRLYADESESMKNIVDQVWDVTCNQWLPSEGPESMTFSMVEEKVYWICRRIDAMEYKRRQAPIGPKITVKDLRRGRQMPIVQSFLP